MRFSFESSDLGNICIPNWSTHVHSCHNVVPKYGSYGIHSSVCLALIMRWSKCTIAMTGLQHDVLFNRCYLSRWLDLSRCTDVQMCRVEYTGTSFIQ
jgi:hypothetical protein